MAGSYKHCCAAEWDRDGDIGVFSFDGIENMGDAYEACEEMHWMIWYLAGGDKKKIEEANAKFYKRVPSDAIGATYKDEKFDG